MKTSTPKPPIPKWLLLDADGESLGRVAAKAASLLRGKHRPEFSPHHVCGDNVVVVNVTKLAIHPSKITQKVYYRHTAYMGHLKRSSLGTLLQKDPCAVVRQAVKGMLPKNRLRDPLLKRLHIFTDALHPHDAQKPTRISL
ncbi:50S ribosomal protein L13 [Candidatus Peribacteria bacterium RIFCSPHIGHO2_01_FULL_51_9]|nr:MAG: 50S ribosomal protein L13 [Candidatus Peribacteria bacterium RIFCSPHIGHO2_01_FULL_51_9]